MSSLAGCGEPQELWSRSEIEDIAADAAADMAINSAGENDVSADLRRMQQEIDDLRSENALLRDRIDSQAAVNDEIYGNVGRLYDWMNAHPH